MASQPSPQPHDTQQDEVQYINGKKTFVPLENNPTVLSALLHHLGVPPTLTCHDIYSLAPDDLAILPRPAHALIFICPASTYHLARSSDPAIASLPAQPQTPSPTEPVLWFPQTIGNACGLIALLHGIANGAARSYIPQNSALDRLLTAAAPLGPEARARLLYDSELLEGAHVAAARMGDTVAPGAGAKVGYHFIAFVKGGDGHLWELEGGLVGPVDRGELGEGEDVLSERALDGGVRRFLNVAGEGEAGGFSLVALGEGWD
ncbi:hypothetical protein FQN55_002022 [Onygenales sp. PD_40]|nr:hypothetical protein FQN55_002022 [Onygenales sp. PD_40]KAK2795266.1 hypothetical protein FQN52_006196 [Onygenales sp. PD_12]KAK2807686.1 hypothetical protein FQN51_000123 [Onygenales sp. PD_10]